VAPDYVAKRPYAALRPFAGAAFTAEAAAARTLASARFTTCFEAFWNWSNAAEVAANVDLNAFIATSEPAGADLLALSTQLATPFE
jgi:hypothetical protein